MLRSGEQAVSGLDDLRSFVEVARAGGLNRAARRLGLSKSVVSRQVARLEAELGVRLLTRSTRGVGMSEAGSAFLARIERILDDLEDAREAVALQAGAVVGRLRLSVPLSFGVRHIAPVLADLAVRHPGLELDVSYSDRLVDPIGERFDAAIRIGMLRDSSLVARRLAPVRAVLVASPAYLDRRGRPREPADLAGHDCLIYTGRADPDWRFRVGKRWVKVRPEGRLRSDSGDAIIQWARAGLGIADAPSFLVGEAIDEGALEPLLLDYPTGAFGIHVVRPPGAHVPAKVRVLIETLVEHFADQPSWERCLARAEHRWRAPLGSTDARG